LEVEDNILVVMMKLGFCYNDLYFYTVDDLSMMFEHLRNEKKADLSYFWIMAQELGSLTIAPHIKKGVKMDMNKLMPNPLYPQAKVIREKIDHKTESERLMKVWGLNLPK
jgi:hypothetical protein